jgi:hypothetical protein
MNRILVFALAALCAALFATPAGKPIYTLQPVSLADVSITDEFWAPKTLPRLTTTAVRLEVEPQTRHYKAGEIAFRPASEPSLCGR